MPLWVGLVLGVLAFGFVGLVMVRILAKIVLFPCPFNVGWLLENPFRKHLFGAKKTVAWMGVDKSMKILELGSGTGFLTVEVARKIGSSGRLYCMDIQPEMAAKTRERARNHKLDNVKVVVADALALPFEDNSFELAFLVTVLGEIPNPDVALKELNRVIVPGGMLSVAEIIADPHYCLRTRVKRLANHAGFEIVRESGNFLAYALNFRKIK